MTSSEIQATSHRSQKDRRVSKRYSDINADLQSSDGTDSQIIFHDISEHYLAVYKKDFELFKQAKYCRFQNPFQDKLVELKGEFQKIYFPGKRDTHECYIFKFDNETENERGAAQSPKDTITSPADSRWLTAFKSERRGFIYLSLGALGLLLLGLLFGILGYLAD